jgi:hypothetical protein
MDCTLTPPEVFMANGWTDEDTYWRENYRTRAYGQGIDYDTLRGGYRYGYEASTRYPGRAWNDIEADLERDWANYQHRGQSTWSQVKEAVRDAWDRMMGRQSRTL